MRTGSGDGAEPTVLYTVADEIATITFNRPARLNAFTADMRATYLDLLVRANGDEAVKAIVITGAGRGFCAGADRDDLDGLDADGLRARRAEQRVPFDIAMELEKPVIAAVNGAAAGIGFAHMLMADVRFAADTARFTTAFAKLGLVAEGGISWLLPRLVGTARALDLLMSSRLVDADEALRIGLVQWVVPAAGLLTAARAYALDLVRNSSGFSMANMRRQVYGDWSRERRAALAATEHLVLESLDRPEFAARAARRP
jgi:enoyl-CoA hydratase/carnithine racemase